MQRQNRSRKYKQKLDLARVGILAIILTSMLIIDPGRFDSGVSIKSLKINEFINNTLMTFNKQTQLDSDIIDNNIEKLSNNNENLANTVKPIQAEASDFIYLSDIPYMEGISTTQYDKIRLDKNINNGLITLIVNGKNKSFMKGIFAHANATIAWDLRNYDYDYLTAYLGVDAGAGNNGNGVKFEVHTSENGVNWTLKEQVDNNAVFKGVSEAYFLKYPIKGVNYIKIVIQNNGNNASDHSVLANAKLIKEGYEGTAGSIDWLHEVSYYDEQLKNIDDNQLLGNKELLLYQREFVNKVGYDNLVMLAESGNDYVKAIKWLFESKENLRMYLISGAPDGSYITSMQVLTDLYKNYHEDFDNQEATKYGYTTLGTLYRRMAISLSLTHSKTTYFWMNGPNVERTNSNAVNRYRIFKEIYLTGRMRFTSTIDFTKWFEQYEIGEMRYVMNSIMDDDEMIWLNEYTQSFIDANPGNAMWYLSPHPYMKYVQPDYSRPEYYDEANKDYYDEKYKGIFSKYGVPFGEKGVGRMWMNLESGAVCGGISKLGASNRNAHGVPATVVSQPGHAAFAYYTMNDAGDGYWTLNNVVTDWEQSGKTERLNDRMPLGWGNDSYVNGFAASYILMAQEAMNHNEQYELSKKYYMIADMYQDDAVKREEYLRKSLKALPYNVDSWWALIKLYNANPNTTEEEYFQLASDLADALMPFPLPMKNLIDQLADKFTSSDYIFNYKLLVVNTLTEAKNLPNTATDRVMQPGNTRDVANFLLGNVDTQLATFSFDDVWYPGYIVLRSNLYEMDVYWDYSLDGKKTWTEVYSQANRSHFIQLTKEELASITDENDIYVHIKGVSTEYNDRNTFKIDIKTGDYSKYANSIYANDLENRLIGVDNKLEWKFPEDDKWTPFTNSAPDLTGNKTVSVRVKATGTSLASSSQDYTFTLDSDIPEKKYIPVEHLLSVYDYISESVDTSRPYYAKNIIDATPKTLWHSDFRVSVQDSPIKPYISIELDSARFISALDFQQVKYKSNDTDVILNATVYVSIDGNAWTKAGTIQTDGPSGYGKLYTIDFQESVYGKYVKFEMETDKPFVSLAMINLYEDTTKTFSANFSFDGNNRNKIIINGTNIDYDWEYSLDSGKSWTTVSRRKEIELTLKELAQINVNDNMIVRKKGTETEYVINFYEGKVPERSYLNDLENRLIGVANSDTIEWKYPEYKDWISYSEEEPITLGDKILQVRTKATGTTLASDYIEYQFTEDDQPETRKYIPVKNMSIYYVSSEGIDIYSNWDPNTPEDDYQDIQYASYLIDGNPYTFWHTSYDYFNLDEKKEVIIELNTPKYISSLEFLPYEGLGGLGSGKPEKMEVYISMDDVEYTKAAEVNWSYLNGDIELRTINFGEDAMAKYIKLVGKQTYGGNSYMAGSMINLYEDTTDHTVSDKEIEFKYSETELTNQDVEVTIVNSDDITITNNEGLNKYTFTKNGSFAFRFTDELGKTGIAVATVENIDKDAPIGTITYDIEDKTDGPVVATLTANENIIITNNNGSNTYEFTTNKSFTFEFEDEAGNYGEATATVNWIDCDELTWELRYSTEELTNQNVTVTLVVAENVTIKNNDGSNTYEFNENGTFEFEIEDDCGNSANVEAEVTWIDKIAPRGTITYDIEGKTTGPVTATLTANEDIIITNNDGSNKYVFTKNDSFTFEFKDKAGNTSTATATVNWIESKELTWELRYSTEEITNQDVTVTLVVAENVTITNNNGSNEYVFKQNGSFTFEFKDDAGNTATATATVNNIDKDAPVGTITYSIKTPTNGNVIATLTANEDIIITNNNGSNEYVFTENGSFTFEFKDKAGNTATATATVNNIDKDAPIGTITFDINSLTNQDVTATLTVEDGVRITNNKGSNKYVFTKNGSFIFEFVDEAGNVGSALAKVDWIDKDAPVGKITFDIEGKTTGPVTATLTANEDIIITNNKGSNKYVFTKNGTFTFEFKDKAGNTATATATVNWITDEVEEPEKPEQPSEPSTPSKPTEPSNPTQPTTPSETTKPNNKEEPNINDTTVSSDNASYSSGNEENNKDNTIDEEQESKEDNKSLIAEKDKNQIKKESGLGIKIALVSTAIVGFMLLVVKKTVILNMLKRKK